MGEVTHIRPGIGGGLTPPIPLNASHDLNGFCCGKEPLDDWLRQRALNAEGRSARTYVVCQGQAVVGYYALATGAEKRENVPKKMQRNMPEAVPLITLARLAVDVKNQGQRLGESLLRDALLRCLEIAQVRGTRAVLVHAIDADALAFYLKYDFMQFPMGTQTLFLPIETINQVFAAGASPRLSLILAAKFPQHELTRTRLTGNRTLLLQVPQAGARPLGHGLEQPHVGPVSKPRSAITLWAMSAAVSEFSASAG